MKVDVAVIGAGTAGLNARREVEKRGGRVVMIEGGAYGTTCARVGCMPSKLLIAAADAAHGLETAPLFGVHPGADRRIDGPAVMERVQRERNRFVGFVVKDTEAIPEAQRLRGHAQFVGPTTLLVDERIRVEARAVVVAAGSHPFLPPPFDAIRDQVLTSDDLFDLPDLPVSLAVIGTGIIALELGQAMQRLGVRVAFFNPYDEVGPFTDPEVKDAARRDLGAELDLRIGVEAQRAEVADDGIRLHWRDAGGAERTETFERVLVAAGRRPNIAGLKLEATGLPLSDKGLPAIDPETAQCGDAPIFFAGDISGHVPLLHEASDEGRIAGANAMLWPKIERHDRRTKLAVAFTDPQMAMVGLRHADLPAGRHAIGSVSFENQGRARVAGANRGLVRIYGELESCRLLGAEMFGPGMEHMAHLLAWSVQQELSVPAALSMPFYHPVLEEGLRSGLRDLGRNLKAMGRCRPEDHAEAPGD
ncbi:MAG TPA: dihydrolipoyl dehydrogenase [Pelomicrobium sp.]|nr:dihydrolipoyl dehydrogenase [Pelomicrobium sp.]